MHWRPREAERLAADPGGYARWLVEPIAQVQTLELLAELAETPNPKGEAAAPIRRDLLPQVEAAFALHVAADDPWRDLFALWQLTDAPHTLNDLWFLATAIAYRYATMARRVAGPVIGTGPFEGEQLVSASAALGTVLWQLRIYPSLVPELVDHVADRIRADGGWGDPGQPTDILTTLVAADLLIGLDPDFEPRRTVAWFAHAQEPEGWWRALDPEVPWLTAAVVDWLERAARPFVERFRWPGALKLDLDRRTPAAVLRLVRRPGPLDPGGSGPGSRHVGDRVRRPGRLRQVQHRQRAGQGRRGDRCVRAGARPDPVHSRDPRRR